MATLADLRQDTRAALDLVSTELTGLAGSVEKNMDKTERAAVGDTVRWPVTGKRSTNSISPSMTIPNGSEEEVTNGSFTLTKMKNADPIAWEGESIKAMNNSGLYQTIYGDQIAQAIRVIRNEIEADLLAAGMAAASRAYGTVGTLPFGTASDMSDFAALRKILNVNGTPGNRRLVISNDASANLVAKMSNLFKANEAGSDALLKQGIIGSVAGFGIGETGAEATHTAGTGSGYKLNGAVAKYDTTIGIDTGSGTVLAGDLLSFDGGADKYLVKTGVTAPGNVVIQAPGSIAAYADAKAVALSAAYSFAGLAFSPDALRLIARAPAGDDAAVDEFTMQDAYTGITYRIALYEGYHKKQIEVSCVWGAYAVKPEHIAMLIA